MPAVWPPHGRRKASSGPRSRLIGSAALALALCVGCGAAAGCRRASTPGSPAAADADAEERGAEALPNDAGDSGEASQTGSAGARLPPIPDDPLFTNLTVPGFPTAVVSVPNGATSPRPLLIVLHGSGDRPDWNCDAWRHITRAQGFVLCPRGQDAPAESTKDDKRYTHRGGAYLRAHVDAALAALVARFAGYVDIDRVVVTGFSLGATQAAQLALEDPRRFSRVAQIEGGDGVWTATNIRLFSTRGGRRVLFGCGSSWCIPVAKAAAERLKKGAVDSRVVYANVGHTTDRPLQEAIMRDLAWFLDGDVRWATAP